VATTGAVKVGAKSSPGSSRISCQLWSCLEERQYTEQYQEIHLIRHTEVARDDAASVMAVYSNADTGIRYYRGAGD